MEPDIAKIMDAVRRSKDPRADERLIEAALCQRSLLEFSKAAWHIIEPGKTFKVRWYHEAICEHLEAVYRRDIKKLVINQPFRSLKSTLASVMFPVWTWTTRPSEQFLCVSYAEKLALRDNLKHRRIGDSKWYRDRWGHVWDISGDQNQKGRFDNSKAGYRIGVGMTGGIMGDGADVLILDDPQDRQAANSDAELERAITDYDEGVSTRLNDPAESATILIMQRLSMRDLTNHVLSKNKEDFVHLCLPALYEYDRHCTTYFNGYTWEDPRRFDPETGEELTQEECEGICFDPERFPEHVLDAYRERGPFFFSGQLQQNPVPSGGGIIKDDDWQWWPTPDYPAPEPPLDRLKNPPFDYIVASLDTAFKEREENDFHALVVLGMWRDTGLYTFRPFSSLSDEMPTDPSRVPMPDTERMRVMVMHAWQKHLLLHGPQEVKPLGMSDLEWNSRGMRKQRSRNWGLVEWVVDTCREFRVNKLIIEDSAIGHQVNVEMMKMYAKEPWTVEMVVASRDKVARTHAIQHLFSNGQVYLPSLYDHSTQMWRRPHWAQSLIDESSSFPKGENDDRHDAMVHGLQHLRDIGMALRQDEEVDRWDDIVRSGGGAPMKALYDV